MSFVVRLSEDQVLAEAGSTAPVNIEIANRSDDSDTFEISVEGVDPEWVAVPVPTLTIEPRDIQTEKVFFKTPRTSESSAGAYPFVLKVRSMTSGEVRSVQGVLQIKPFHHISLDLHPRRGKITPLSPEDHFQVTVMNLGNHDENVQLFASDPDDACSYQFEQEQVTVGPGQQKEVELTARAAKRGWFTGTRLHSLTVSGRSKTTANVMAASQAQVEVRPLLSPGTLLGLLLVGGLAAAWIALLPKQPAVNTFRINPATVVVGTPYAVNWYASNAGFVRIMQNDEVLLDGLPTQGERQIVAKAAGNFELYAVAVSGDRTARSNRMVLIVNEPPPVPDPLIEAFEITPRNLKLGESFLVRYKFNDGVVRAVLSPPGQTLDLKVDTIKLVADLKGSQEYKIIAENSAGKTVTRSIKVNVVEASAATIVVFSADRTEVTETDGRVVLNWQLTNAARLELSDGKSTEVLENSTGSREVVVLEDTTFTITGYDEKGLTVKKSIKVKVKKEPPPPPDTTGGEPTTTGGDG
ncbi:MAG: hypothetical protein HONBIEJF_01113 [Fimbriimonadaceae bacterium]|nr:hypothetical protein [Fimbriimonadaceae bacterium]